MNRIIPKLNWLMLRLPLATFALVFALSAVVVATMAWYDFSQSYINLMVSHGERSVCLLKLEKTAAGVPTGIPLPNAEFYLYKTAMSGESNAVDEQIGARYLTDTQGKIAVSGLDPGHYYFLETNPDYHHTFDLDETGVPVTRYEFELTGLEANDIVVTAYNRRIETTLSLKKILENEDDSPLTDEQEGQLFEFVVAFSNGENYQYSVDGGELQSLNDGKLYLAHEQTATFNGVPVGTHYSITETAMAGHIVSGTNSRGNVPEEGIVALFTNTYFEQVGRLTVTKQVVGAGMDADREFEFVIAFQSDSKNPVPESIKYQQNGGPVMLLGEDGIFSLKHDEEITFLNLPAGLRYTVTERDDTAVGYLPLNQAYTGVTIDAQIELPFFNLFRPVGTPRGGPGHLEVSKRTRGLGADQDMLFTFILTLEGDDLPVVPVEYTVDGTLFELSGGGEFQLSHGQTAVFELPDGVRYTVTEMAADGYDASIGYAQGYITENQISLVGFTNEKTRELPPTEVTVKKVVVGEVSDRYQDKAYHFKLVVDGQILREFDLRDGEISQPFDVPAGSFYEIVEDDYSSEGFLQSVMNGYGTAFGGDTVSVVQTNTFIADVEIMIDGEKNWNMDGHDDVEKPSQITIHLKDGDKIVDTVLVTSNISGEWTYNFEVPKYNGSDEIDYIVEEKPLEFYRSEVDRFNITNSYISPISMDPPVVRKTIIGGTPEQGMKFYFKMTAQDGAPLPDGSTNDSKIISVVGEGEAEFGEIIYTKPGVYIYNINEIDMSEPGYIYDKLVYTLTVEVEEQNGELVIAYKTLTENGETAEMLLFSNDYDANHTNISVVVVWDDDGYNRPHDVVVQLYRGGVAYGEPIVLSASNNWTHLWRGLEKDSIWTVDEINVPLGYTKVVSGDAVNGFIVTNRESNQGEKLSAEVSKIWDDSNAIDRPRSAIVQLYRDGSSFGNPIILNADNGWSYTWSNLEEESVWTVDEIVVPSGYYKTITGNVETGFLITNSRGSLSPGQITISGVKAWDHKDNPQNEWPNFIVLFIKADGKVIRQKKITEAEDWSWSLQVDRYAADGHEIIYTIDEQATPNYRMRVDAFNLHNTYDLTKFETQGESNEVNQNTGRGGNISLPMALMTTSGTMLILILWRRRRGKQLYVGKYAVKK